MNPATRRTSALPGRPINVAPNGALVRDRQPEAVARILKHDEGVLCAGTAFGKTVAAAFVIAARRTNTLVLVHRAQLLDQWREKLACFLDLPIDSIGQIGGGKTKQSGIIDGSHFRVSIERARLRIRWRSMATS